MEKHLEGMTKEDVLSVVPAVVAKTHPSPHHVINMKNSHNDVERGVNYVIYEVLYGDRGAIQWDESRDSIVISLTVDAVDRNHALLLRQQKAHRVWLVMKSHLKEVN